MFCNADATQRVCIRMLLLSHSIALAGKANVTGLHKASRFSCHYHCIIPLYYKTIYYSIVIVRALLKYSHNALV